MPDDVTGVCGRLRGHAGRHPLFAAALVAVACVAAAGVHPGWGFLTGAALFLTGWRMLGARWGAAWLLCGWLAAGVFTWREAARETAERELLAAGHAAVRARMLEDARGGSWFWTAPAELLDGSHAGAKVWWQGSGEVPVAGSVISAKGNFLPLPGPRNPGEFDRAAWLRRQGVAVMFDAGMRAGGTATGRFAALAAKVRHGFRNAVTAGLAEDSREAQVIRAVVIGEHPPHADSLIAAFRNSGTLHVFSVSGLHVAMVGSIGWLLLAGLGVPRRWAVPALLPLIFGYAWITGLSAPAVRSAWMMAVFLGAFVFRRKPDLLNALGAVLLAAMLWDGRLLFQPGVQLSYGVVAAIAIGSAWATKTFAWMAAPELYLPTRQMTRWQTTWLGLRCWLAQSLGVSLAAGLGSAPLTAFHFGLVTPVSVLAGLPLLPLVFALLAAAMLSAALHPVAPALARGVNRINGHTANFCVKTAEFFAAIPGGHFRTRRETRPMLLVYDLEHGQGAACFYAGREGAVLLDCGGRRGFEYLVAPSLRQLGIEPDSVVLSHPDGGHLGGGPAVWQALPVRQAMLPVKLSRSPSFRAWALDSPKAGVQTRLMYQGSRIPFPDGASLEILHAPDPFAVNAIADDRVAVFRLHWRGWKLLFTGDAGMGTEMKLLDRGADVTADVIIAGRHRGDLGLCDRFLDAVRPRVIIASNSPFPAAEKLAPTTVGYWKSRGIQVLDQGETGGVTVTVDDGGCLQLAGFLGAEPVTLNPR